MYVIYRKEKDGTFASIPEISEFSYDRKYCEAFVDIYFFKLKLFSNPIVSVYFCTSAAPSVTSLFIIAEAD